MSKKWILLALLASLAFAACAPAKYEPPTVTPDQPVADATGKVSKTDLAAFTDLTKQLATAGFETGVAIVGSCGGCDQAQFATKFGNKNGIGKDDNGIAIVVYLEETGGSGKSPAIFVAIGKQLEGTLNDAKVGRLLDATFVPARAANEWQRGLKELLTALLQVLTGQKTAEDYKAPEETNELFNGFLGIVCILIIGFGLLVVLLIIFGGATGGGGYSGGSSSGSSFRSSTFSSGGSHFGGGGFSGGGAGR